MSLDSVFASSTLTSTAKNRQLIFDDDVLHYFLTKVDNLSKTERILFGIFLVHQYGILDALKRTLNSEDSDIRRNDVVVNIFNSAVAQSVSHCSQ